MQLHLGCNNHGCLLPIKELQTLSGNHRSYGFVAVNMLKRRSSFENTYFENRDKVRLTLEVGATSGLT